MENHGADFKNRWQIVKEKVEAMRAIWTNEEPEYHGKYVDFDPIWSYPKPIQDGGPPIWMGANSKWVFERIADYADGWMPIGGLGSGNMNRLKEALDSKNRKIEDLTLALFGGPKDRAQIVGRIEQGFDEVIFSLPSEGPDQVLPLLDEYADIVKSVRG
tara:strand:+ start:41 stop:517 length:477 start_codon:yes stop_codon:yes gene_type:complete